MAGQFQQGFGFKLILKEVTEFDFNNYPSVSGASVSGDLTSGIRIEGLTDLSDPTNTNFESVVTHDSAGGFAEQLPTQNSYQVNIAGLIKLRSKGYQELKRASIENVDPGLPVYWRRESPIPVGGSSAEIVEGYGYVGSFTPSLTAGAIAKFTATLNGSGKIKFTPAA